MMSMKEDPDEQYYFKKISQQPTLSQCSISIPSENVRKHLVF